MTQGQYIITRKVNILELGKTFGNISDACRKLAGKALPLADSSKILDITCSMKGSASCLCLPRKGCSYCVDCYEDYVKNCLSQSRDMRGSTQRD